MLGAAGPAVAVGELDNRFLTTRGGQHAGQEAAPSDEEIYGQFMSELEFEPDPEPEPEPEPKSFQIFLPMIRQ